MSILFFADCIKPSLQWVDSIIVSRKGPPRGAPWELIRWWGLFLLGLLSTVVHQKLRVGGQVCVLTLCQGRQLGTLGWAWSGGFQAGERRVYRVTLGMWGWISCLLPQVIMDSKTYPMKQTCQWIDILKLQKNYCHDTPCNYRKRKD